MYELKKNGKVFTSKFVGTGPSSYEKRIYRAAVSQTLRNTAVEDGRVFLGVGVGGGGVNSCCSPDSKILQSQLLRHRYATQFFCFLCFAFI